MSKETVIEWLVTYLARQLEVDPREIRTDTNFVDCGLDSAMTMGMIAELEQWLGYELPIGVLWEYPTIQLLAEGSLAICES